MAKRNLKRPHNIQVFLDEEAMSIFRRFHAQIIADTGAPFSRQDAFAAIVCIGGQHAIDLLKAGKLDSEKIVEQYRSRPPAEAESRPEPKGKVKTKPKSKPRPPIISKHDQHLKEQAEKAGTA